MPSLVRARVTELAEFAVYLGVVPPPPGVDAPETSETISRMRSGIQSSPAMRAGTAFHKFLEHAGEGEHDTVIQDGLTFKIECDIGIYLPPAREIEVVKEIGGVLVTGHVDNIDGNTVHDYKTTAKFSAEKYLDAYQWRYYLTMMEAQRFVWDVFVVSEKEGVYSVRSYHQLEARSYENMEADCRYVAESFNHFATKYLPERIIQ